MTKALKLKPEVRQIAKINMAAYARQFSQKSLDRLARALDSDDERVAIDAAVRLLDRGHGKPTQTVVNGDKSPDQMSDAELIDAIRAAALGELGETGTDKNQLN